MENNPNLKIHIEEDESQPTLESRLAEGLPLATELAQHFQALTGWVLDYVPSEKAKSSFAPDSAVPVFGQFETTDLAPEVPTHQTALHRGQCDQLLSSINGLLQRLETAELALWQHQHYAGDGGQSFLDFQFPSRDSDVLATMLRQASDSMHASGAALYLLDDETTQLNLRATIGPVSAARRMQAVRPLEHALADLEALVGNVVTITDPMIGESWKIPEPYQFGVCTMLGEPGMPLGTVWVFFDTAREATPQELRLLEDLCERIGLEVQSRGKGRQQQKEMLAPLEQELQLTAKLNDCRLPSYPPEVDGWKVAGWTYRHDALAGVFHEWSVTPSGHLSVAVGQVAGPMIPATINANNLRSLICAHREYRHSARTMVEKLNENVWTNSPGDDLASLLYVLIDPETQTLQAVNAGDGGMVFGNHEMVQSLDQFQNPLGVDLEMSFQQWEKTFEDSDTLILFSQGLRNALSESLNALNDAELFADLLTKHAGDAHAILSAIEDRFFQSDFQHVAGDLSVVVLTRSSTPDAYSLAAAEELRTIEAELANGDTDLLSALEDEIAALERMGFIRPDRNVIEPGAIEIDADQWFDSPDYPDDDCDQSWHNPFEDADQVPQESTEPEQKSEAKPASLPEIPQTPADNLMDQKSSDPPKRKSKAAKARKENRTQPKSAKAKATRTKASPKKPAKGKAPAAKASTAKSPTAKSKSAGRSAAGKTSARKNASQTSEVARTATKKASAKKTANPKTTARKSSKPKAKAAETTVKKSSRRKTTAKKASTKKASTGQSNKQTRTAKPEPKSKAKSKPQRSASAPTESQTSKPSAKATSTSSKGRKPKPR